MEDPLDFPGIKNIEVCIFEVELNYPASQVELVQMIEMISRQPAKHIKITSPAFNNVLPYTNIVKFKFSNDSFWLLF